MANDSRRFIGSWLCVVLAAGANTVNAQDGGHNEAEHSAAQHAAATADPTRRIPGIDGLSDPLVAGAIESELWEARGVDPNGIDVQVAQGVVTLTGTVDNILESERAVRIASLTRGVASVIDRLEVADSGRSDEGVERDVEAALVTDPATESWEIQTSVVRGNVTLSGAVQSGAERRLAERVAKSVRGVRSVDNRLEIESGGSRSDYEIASEIRALLDWDVRLDTRLMTVDVTQGAVTLAGSVASDFERRLATAMAWVPGANDVDVSGLEVQWWRRDAMQREKVPTQFSDADVRAAVERALSADPRVSSLDVQASVANGTATLRGSVDNLRARRVAAEAASNTVGVERVENYLKVRPQAARDETELAADVRAALARDALLQADDIVVDVDGGRVRLAGTVLSPFERAYAADVVSKVSGVTNVVNGLHIGYDGPDYTYGYDEWDPLLSDYDYERDDEYRGTYAKSDTEIEDEIEEELFWSP